jgi:hypothetical protein
MAVGLPAKTTYANGDVFSASDINDTNGTLNLVGQTTNFYAGKNKIINGDFFVNQRNFTSTTTDGAYGFDRFKLVSSSGGTMSAQTFTPGTAPVSGYEGRNFCRIVTTGQSGAGVYTMLEQDVEDVTTFAGQTVTFSFWAKAATGTPKIALQIFQMFGAGGSPSAIVSIPSGQSTLSTSWARYSLTIAIPSIAGKTLGTTANTSYLGIRMWVSAGTSSNTETGSLGIQSNTFDIWGVQIEAGSTATAFQTATGTIQGELAACQRYYYRQASTQTNYPFALGFGDNAGRADITMSFPVTMRIPPNSIDFANVGIYDGNAVNSVTGLTFPSNGTSQNATRFLASGSWTATLYRPYVIAANSSASSYLGLSAEL